MLHFRNARHNPRELAHTNWWDLPYAAQGYFYSSFSSGEFRLLVPPAYEYLAEEMRQARRVVVTRGPWFDGARMRCNDSLQIAWEVADENPLVVHLPDSQFDQVPYSHDVHIGIGLTAISQNGKMGAWPARFLDRRNALAS